MAIKKINDTCLTSIAAAIREKNGTTETYKPSEMAAAISAIETGGGGLPEEAFKITGDCSYRFANGGWDWFINEYGKKVQTENITNGDHMFSYCKVEEIPFELNFNTSARSCTYMFAGAENLLIIPKFRYCNPSDLSGFFSNCYALRELPEDMGSWFNWSAMDGATSEWAYSRAATFNNCYSLRSVPMSFLEHGNPNPYLSYSIYYNGFTNCYALDEVIDLPIPHKNAAWTSNTMNSTFAGCSRLKNMTFKCPDGKPQVVKWKGQTLDMGAVGFVTQARNILNHNSGITADKEVKDDATYQALKNDKDWFTCLPAYSRYNHDSAVATINSLPDASAYLATAGGTNTIKFKGEYGSKTDGGAINTLTQEEIAVATAKGWTVTLS